jgi:hypothetical protein
MEEESRLSVGLSMNVIFVGKNTGFMIRKLDCVKIVDIVLSQRLPTVLMIKVLWSFIGKKDGNLILKF